MKKSHFGHNLKYKYIKIYRYHGGGLQGLRRVIDTIREVDWFDWLRGTKTAEYKTEGYTNKQYMFYAPAYTSVVKEMLRMSFNYYTSAVKYTDYERKEVFIDLGCGAGKVVLMADDSGYFDCSLGVELDEELRKLATANINKAKSASVIGGNVEEEGYLSTLFDIFQKRGIKKESATLFVFNKNSYGPSVLENSLNILKQHFSSIVYLYQNPVHQKVFDRLGFECVLEDDAGNTAHKNFKYKIYLLNNS